jgi:GNAT superfamily N-acetyltransferase
MVNLDATNWASNARQAPTKLNCMTHVRALTTDDFDAWLPLWNGYLEFYETKLAPEITRHTFERLTDSTTNMHAALALTEDGEAIGMATWLTHPGTWSRSNYVYLEDLFVSAAARGTGAGRALIEHVSGWADAAGAGKVYWLTAETNKTAQQLYDRVAKKTGFIHYEIKK